MESHWDDSGVAICRCINENLWPIQARLIVTSEHSQHMLLNRLIHTLDIYQRQQETSIVWKEPGGTDFALRFENVEGCLSIWNFILEGRNRLVDEGKPLPTP